MPQGHQPHRLNHSVMPDIVMDFTKLGFSDKSFKLVVFDPPHLATLNETSILAKHYGVLNAQTWQSDLKNGFKECWRVLDDFGILVFKWCDVEIDRKSVV